jgi:hypothetical protein
VTPAAVAHLAPIGLDEVIALADLQTRHDRKYLLPTDAAEAILEGVDAWVLEIEGRRSFRYESIYFDTEQWHSYLSAARRRPRRFKVRTRTYLDSDECVLEVKVRDPRGNTVKHRYPYDICTRRRLTAEGAAFVAGVESVAPHAHLLEPVLTVAYDRTTLVLEHSKDRVTVDDDATWVADGTRPVTLRGLTLLETKTSGPASTLDRALWRAGHRPVTISKYCTGLALLRSHLPANKWHRVLNRDVIPNLVASD